MPIRYTANWEDWRGTFGTFETNALHDETAPSVIGQDSELVPVAQKFKIIGTARLSHHQIEDSNDTLEVQIAKVIDAMKEALEGYLYVTSPVASWEVDFQIEQQRDFATDSLVFRAAGSGWFTAHGERGNVEVIDVSPEPREED